jgi:AraC-like DNA-binding protein
MSARQFNPEDLEKLAEQADFHPTKLATCCGISLRQLERDFERLFRKTPTEWLRKLRCRIVLQRLTEGCTSKALVPELKFGSASHLCHEFKKVYGDSPRRVAQKQRSVANGQ